MTDTVWSGLDEQRPALADFYRDLDAHPELSLQEHRTAQRVAQALRDGKLDTLPGNHSPHFAPVINPR